MYVCVNRGMISQWQQHTSVTWPATTRSLLSRWKWRVFYLDASRLVSWSLACQLPGQLLRGRWSTGENDEFLSGVHSQSTEGFKLWPHPLVMNMYVVRIVCTQPGYWGLWTVATPTSHEYVRHTNCVYTVRLLGELNCGHAHWLWICMSCVYTAGLLWVKLWPRPLVVNMHELCVHSRATVQSTSNRKWIHWSTSSWYLVSHREHLVLQYNMSGNSKLIRSFFQDITHPSSSLYHLFPLQRDMSVLSRLRTATRFPRPVSRTKKYCFFINYALNHYQVPSCNS